MLIKNCDFRKNNPELTDEEAEYLKKDAYRILEIRYDLYLENKKDEKVKKHLFNK